MRRSIMMGVLSVAAVTAVAQPRPMFGVDDFVDPRGGRGAIFVSRLIAGAAAGAIDDYRPLHQGAGFVQIANSLYVSRFQLDFKHDEVRGSDANGPAHAQVCKCNPPIYFPTAAAAAIPAAPLPSRKETLQAAFYYSVPGRSGDLPIMLRTRVTAAWQPVETDVTLLNTGRQVEHLSGSERSIGVDTDTYLRIGGHPIYGSLVVARTGRFKTTDNPAQTEVTYTNRFPAVVAGPVLVRALMTVGGVSGRGASGLNVVNPAFEAFWHEPRTGANVHLIWSAQSLRSGAEGWKMHHQVAFFVDRALYFWRSSPR
jgi:hypothetical protein